MQPRAARPAYRFLVDGPLSRLAWLPIPIFLAVMAVLRGSHLRGAFESPVLLMLANFLFLTLASVLVVV